MTPDSMVLQDQRADIRVPYAGPVEIFLRDPKTGGISTESIKATGHDISRGGMRISSESPLNSKEVFVRFLYNEEQFLVREACTVWKTDGRNEYGLQFDTPLPEDLVEE